MNDRPVQDAARDGRWRRRLFWAGGLAVAALTIIAAIDGLTSDQDAHHGQRLRHGLVMAAGAIYLAVILLARAKVSGRRAAAMMILLAVAMRAPCWLGAARPGSDVCRYLWDGAVTAEGENPYLYTPQAAADGATGNGRIDELAQEAGPVLESVNHPHLRTIYPPAAQALFAAAYRLTPFSILG